MKKNVLVVGGGGRCHAIVAALRRSACVDNIYAAPGNAGIAQMAHCTAIKDTDIACLVDFAHTKAIDLTIVGPEAPLSMGIVDRFAASGLRIFGPTMAAARMESSKSFAKALMQRHGIPTAEYSVFDNYHSAWDYVRTKKMPIVLKYDGLAAGKGVVVAADIKEAKQALSDMLMSRKFGDGSVVVEEFLDGREFSFMCLVNGRMVVPLETAQDYKRAYDGNHGPNTGGMGAYSPAAFVTKEDLDFAMNGIMQKTAQALYDEGCPFVGVLYGGLIKTAHGIKVIEFNVRFGDPETEVVLPRLNTDFYELIENVMAGVPPAISWKPQTALGVTLAAKGYPNSYPKGYAINGLEKLTTPVYHMGTALHDGKITGNGGRVLFVSALSDTIDAAREKVLAEIAKIDCENLFYRSDIGIV
jgi:phosphoribosylamine--glycine ligase